MDDLISLAAFAAVIALLMGYVRFCHRITGDPDDSVPRVTAAPSDAMDTTPPASSGRAR